MARNKDLSSETHQSILVMRNEGYIMREIANKLETHTTLCTTHRTEQRKLALTRIERGVEGPGAQLSKRTSTLDASQVLN